jgi:transposase
MGKPYSMDLRERVVAAVDPGGLSCHRAAAQFGVGVNTAILWVRRFRETGSVAPGQMGGHKPKKISGKHRDWLLERTKARDFTLRGLVAELAKRGLKVDYRSVWEFVHAENLSFTKSLVASERDRPDVARRRAQWQKYQGQIDLSAWSSSTRPGQRPTWPPYGAGRRAAPGSQPKSCTDTGRPQPSLPHCAAIGSRHHGFSMARSTARASQFTSRGFYSRP